MVQRCVKWINDKAKNKSIAKKTTKKKQKCKGLHCVKLTQFQYGKLL